MKVLWNISISMIYYNHISSSSTISSIYYCSCLCCIYVWTLTHRNIYSPMWFYLMCYRVQPCWVEFISNFCINCWPFHNICAYRRTARSTRVSCRWCCFWRAISTNCVCSKIWIIKIVVAYHNFCYILIPFRMANCGSWPCMVCTCLSPFLSAIPRIFIYNKLNNILSIVMPPLVATNIVLIFYISYNTLYYASIFLINIYIISNFLSLCIRTCNYISSIYFSKAFFIKIHSSLFS